MNSQDSLKSSLNLYLFKIQISIAKLLIIFDLCKKKFSASSAWRVQATNIKEWTPLWKLGEQKLHNTTSNCQWPKHMAGSGCVLLLGTNKVVSSKERLSRKYRKPVDIGTLWSYCYTSTGAEMPLQPSRQEYE